MHALRHDNETSVISVKNSTESRNYYILTGLFIQYILVVLLIFRHQHEEHKRDVPVVHPYTEFYWSTPASLFIRWIVFNPKHN